MTETEVDEVDARHLTETAILGGILLDNSQLEKVQSIISVDDFGHVLYAKFFTAMCELFAECGKVDLILMENKLQDELPAVNVFYELAQIMNNTPTAKNTVLYAEQLRVENGRTLLNHSLNNIVHLNKSKKPLDEVLSKAQQYIDDISQNVKRSQTGKSMNGVLQLIADELDAAFDGQKRLKLLTGFSGLDRLLQGMAAGQLIILAARPSQGKTTFALNIMHNVIMRQAHHALMFSLEMGDAEIGRSLIAMHASVPLSFLKDDSLNSDDGMMGRFAWAVGELNKVKFHLETDLFTIGKIKVAAREYKARNPDLSFIVIDYLQLISKPGSESRVLEVSAITRELKLLAKELDLPILALSQLNRNNEGRVDKTPILSDLRDSGSIEQDADMVLFIHRHERDAKIIVGKNRSGACGDLMLTFDGATATFKEPYVQ